MDIKNAKEIVKQIDEAQKVIEDDEVRERKEAIQQQLNKVQEHVNKENFEEAIRTLNRTELSHEIKYNWRKKIRHAEDDIVRRTLPDKPLAEGLLCWNCGTWSNLNDECILDNNKVILVSFCPKCNKRTVMAIPRKRFKVTHPIESFIQPILKEMR